MTWDFVIAKDEGKDSKNKNLSLRMKCSISNPCYCYGRLCLVSNTAKCNEGNVFIDGRPICGTHSGWKELGKHICHELGFSRLVGIKTKGE